MIKQLLLTCVIVFAACGREDHDDDRSGQSGPPGEVGPKGDTGDAGAQGSAGQDAPVAVTPPVDTVQEKIDSIVGDYNLNREFAGQSQLTNGLTCTVYKFGTVASPQFPNSIAQATGGSGWTTRSILTFTTKTVLNQLDSPTTDGMSIMPPSVRSNADYQTWYRLRCTGSLVITETNYYNFDITTDDGGILIVDGLNINNDGNHSTSTKSGLITLNKGVHSFTVDYMQAGGNQALIVKANGGLIDPKYLYH